MEYNAIFVTEQRSSDMADSPTIAWLAAQLADHSMRGIAVGIGALIRAGALPAGTQLPPVRELALALGVSPATVSGAWGELRRYGVVEGRGRTGMRVAGGKVGPRPTRFEDVGPFGPDVLDLTLASPDPALLPPLHAALRHGADAPLLNSYERTPILAPLRASAAARWPYPAEAFMTAHGGYEGVSLALQALVMPGAAVAVEDPTAARLLDILDHLGAHRIAVRCDDHGPDPDALAAALARKPAAFLYQPRTHSVTGRQVGAERLAALAQRLRGTDTLILEDDGVGDLSSLPPASLGRWFPERTVHVLSYSKTLGPDLRLAVLSGSRSLVERIQGVRSFGAGWTSRVLQAAAAWLLADPATDALVAAARSAYAQRRRALIAALGRRGVPVPDHDGLCLWLPVRSEHAALVTLAARGIVVMPGRRFTAGPSQHIRLATSLLTERVDAVADAIALVHADGPAEQPRPLAV